MKLSELQVGQKAIIKSLDNLGELKNRLMELGVLCGEGVELVRKAPLNDPLEIKVGNEYLAIRKEDAEKIEVEDITNKAML